jgi:hypothetical protein
MQNPNRFIRGLSDIGEIVDVCTPAPVPVPAVGVVLNSNTTMNEIEQTLTSDGAQTITLPGSALYGYMLFINGFKQSKSAYTVSGVTLTLPSSLDLFTGDVVSFVYLTN